jgi:Uma2 family endonuclease
MVAIVLAESIRIPTAISSLKSFRRWARSKEYPEHGWYSYLDGEIWADPSMERLIHNAIKAEYNTVLGAFVKRVRTGRYIPDRMWFTNFEAQLSTEPDGMFISFETLTSSLVRLKQGLESYEIQGSPDMTLEVVSPTSVRKDTEVLRELYWRAGVGEYWLVNPLGEQVAFDILRHGPRGYVATRRQGGWLKSSVFGKSFRLVEELDPLGEREFTLEVR